MENETEGVGKVSGMRRTRQAGRRLAHLAAALVAAAAVCAARGDECRGDEVFNLCGSACPRRCGENRSDEAYCTMQCVQGCFCPESKPWHDAASGSCFDSAGACTSADLGCACGPAGCRLERILTYDCHALDIAINYGELAWSTAVIAALALWPGPRGIRLLVCSNLFLWAFQLALCFSLDETGVSVIWSAHAGMALALARNRSYLNAVGPYRGMLSRRLTVATFVLCSLAWVYYALTADALETVAHAAAIVMGWGLTCLYLRCFKPYAGVAVADLPAEASFAETP